ncbi:MAG: BCD family MFS transporter [Merismopedia sp. SIO2A8]|nr:BCD family MFS transporter [Merismopedia sp. SIO2A8]
MATPNFSDQSTQDQFSSNGHHSTDASTFTQLSPLPPTIGLLTMFRLGLFQMGLGIMSVLTLGVLNRILIDELNVPALLAAGAIAMHQFVAPARLWFGQLSDAKPIFGMHRTGYVWIGSILFTSTAFVAVQVVWRVNQSMEAGGWSSASVTWMAVLGLVFAFYGLALSASSTPFAAMLVDISDEENRSKLVSTVWSMLMVGIVIGAISGSVLLKPLDLDAPIADVQAAVNRLFLIIPGIVIGMTFLGTIGIEPKYSRYHTRSLVTDRDDQITLGRAIRILTASRQTGIFFTFLIVMTISLFMQEAVLEPYGGQVFGMQISDTTKLNSYWGMGTLLGIAATGFLVVPRIGKKRTARLGCFLVAGCFVLVIGSGFTRNPQFLQLAVFLFGVGAGVTTNGAISLMLDLTAAETAGTFIGAWGLAQAIARAAATVTGGLILDVGRSILGVVNGGPVPESELFPAYSLVFAAQALGMIIAVGLLSRVNVQEFQDNAKGAIAAVLTNELD